MGSYRPLGHAAQCGSTRTRASLSLSCATEAIVVVNVYHVSASVHLSRPLIFFPSKASLTFDALQVSSPGTVGGGWWAGHL